MTLEQWRAQDPAMFETFVEAAGGDMELMARSFLIAERKRCEWLALQDLCGPHPFIDNAMQRGESVGPWHRALALAVGRAAPNKVKLK